MKNPQTDIVQVIIQDIDSWSNELKRFLTDNEVDTKDKKFHELIELVKQLKVKLSTKKYAGLIFDKNGYIIKTYLLDDFISADELPLDVDYGYYKLVDNKIVLDEERQRQIEEV